MRKCQFCMFSALRESHNHSLYSREKLPQSQENQICKESNYRSFFRFYQCLLSAEAGELKFFMATFPRVWDKSNIDVIAGTFLRLAWMSLARPNRLKSNSLKQM